MSALYQASQIKRRRATKAEMQHRYDELLAIVEAQRPMTCRQVFYQASVRGLVDKTEASCDKVCVALGHLRKRGLMPFNWIADSTRWMRKPRTFSGLGQAIAHTARTYRRALWDDGDAYVEVWLEKDALAGVVVDVTDEFDVPLMVTRGYPSLSFLFEAAQALHEQDRPCFIYHFGDYDPSGQDAARVTEKHLREMAPGAEIHFERVAVTPSQIRLLSLPSRPTKKTDTRSKTWTGGDSVELDAIEAILLRGMVKACIHQHVDEGRLEVLRVAEASERQALMMFAKEAAA
jgi:hypothetical protein